MYRIWIGAADLLGLLEDPETGRTEVVVEDSPRDERQDRLAKEFERIFGISVAIDWVEDEQ